MIQVDIVKCGSINLEFMSYVWFTMHMLFDSNTMLFDSNTMLFDSNTKVNEMYKIWFTRIKYKYLIMHWICLFPQPEQAHYLSKGNINI